MKKRLLCLCFLAGCASAPTAEQHSAAVGGAAGCFAHGLAAAADSGKGERVIVGIALVPLCAMLAGNPAVPAGRSVLVSRK